MIRERKEIKITLISGQTISGDIIGIDLDAGVIKVRVNGEQIDHFGFGWAEFWLGACCSCILVLFLLALIGVHSN